MSGAAWQRRLYAGCQVRGAVGEGLPVQPRFEAHSANREDRVQGSRVGNPATAHLIVTADQ